MDRGRVTMNCENGEKLMWKTNLDYFCNNSLPLPVYAMATIIVVSLLTQFSPCASTGGCRECKPHL